MQDLTKSEYTYLLELARSAIIKYCVTQETLCVDESEVPANLNVNAATFITLTKAGSLRGCIGHIRAIQPLFEDVIENACSAAFKDTRFNPVEESELDEIRIELSIMTPFVPLEYTGTEEVLTLLAEKRPGVMIRHAGHQALFLPQVWEQLPDPTQFLEHLCEKAGLNRASWELGTLEIELNTVTKYKEG